MPDRLFSAEEVHKLFGEIVKECRKELLKKGKVHYKRGIRVPRSELLKCVKDKWKALVDKRLEEFIKGLS